MSNATLFEAAHILGLPLVEAQPLLQRRGLIGPRGGNRNLTLQEIEALAVEVYPWRAHVRAPDSYWVTVGQAAEILEISIPRVKQLVEKGFLPTVKHRTGVTLFRRDQLHVVANARISRKLQA
jgi:hypothetical protein